MPDGSTKYPWVVSRPSIDDRRDSEFVRAETDSTHQKRAEESLRKSEAYLADAQKLSQTGSWAWNPEAGIKYWSEECYRVQGFDPLDGLPRFEELFQRIHPDDQPKLKGLMQTVAREKIEFETDYRLVHPDGAVRDIHTTAHPVFSPTGDFIEFMGTVIDVTDRKRAEEELRRSEANLAEAQRLSHTGSFGCKFSSGEMFWSEETFGIFGYNRATTPAVQAILQRVHPEDQARVQERVHLAASEGKACDLEYRLLMPDDSIKHVHVMAHAAKDEPGGFEFVGAVIDVTERKRAEQELQQLVDLVPQLIAVAGPDGKFIYANRVSREYTGLTLEEFRSVDVIGRTIHPDDVEKARAERKVGFSGIDPFEYEARLLGKDGIYRWFLIRFNPLVEEGRARRWFGTATEIESRKQQEARVRQENVRLEERTRIAQELHDTLLQSFNAATMKLAAAMYGLPSDSPLKPKIDPILDLMEH